MNGPLLTKLARDFTGRISALSLFFFIRTSLFSHYGHRARLVRYSQAYLVCFFVDSFGNAQIFIENLQPQKVFTVEVNKEQKLYITSAKTIFYSK